MKRLLLAFAACSLTAAAWSQVLTTFPQNPTTDDNVTIIFDATQGNGALWGTTETVYAHTGVITTNSTDQSDWQYTQGNWGVADQNVEMDALGDNKFRIQFNIRNFYGIPMGEEVKQLAFVFRNPDGSVVARDHQDLDVYKSINCYTFGNYSSHGLAGSELTVSDGTGAITLDAFDDKLVKVAYYPDGNVNPPTSLSVVMTPSGITPTVTDNTDHLLFETSEVTVRVNKSPLRLSFLRGNTELLSDDATGYWHSDFDKGIRLDFDDAEHLYGTGARAIPVDRTGTFQYLWNQPQYSYGNGAATINTNIPFWVSSGMYGVLVDNYAPGRLDLGRSNSSTIEYAAESGDLSWYFIAGDSYNDVLDGYTELTGKQPLPPRWALGYMQSRFGYEDQAQAYDVVNTMRNEGFPMDAIIFDVYWFGDQTTIGNLAWDATRFPDHNGMISDFNNLGIKTVLISETYVNQSSFNYNHVTSNGYVGTDGNGNAWVITDFWAGWSSLLDIFNPDAASWLWSKYEDQIADGVAGLWCDLGEPENHPAGMQHVNGSARELHNAYGNQWSKLIWDGYQTNHDQRVFTLTRAGWSGMQRFSTFAWSGDVNRSWSGMQAQVPIMLGMGMSGSGYMHSDAGGFAGGSFNEELYVRWLQLGAFSPVMRPHGEGQPSEPIYYSNEAKDIVRNFSNLRYQLLPYNYTLAWHNSTKGTPLACPMNFFTPEDETLADINDQYLWGENMMVAPIFNPGQTQRFALFPEGDWVDWWSGKTYAGGATHIVNGPLEQMPLFVKAGSFIPMAPEMLTTDGFVMDELYVRYYPDAGNPSTSFTLYDDDGSDPDALTDGNNEQIEFTGTVASGSITINVDLNGNGYTGAPASRAIEYQVQRIDTEPLSVLVDGTDIPLATDWTDYNATSPAAIWIDSTEVIYVKMDWSGSSTDVVINFQSDNVQEEPIAGTGFYLQHPFPNPVESGTTIGYNILEAGTYQLDIVDQQGRLVRDFGAQQHSSGSYSIQWNAEDGHGHRVAAGVYHVRLKGPESVQTQQLAVE